MSNQNLKDVTTSSIIMRVHRWLVMRREKNWKSPSKAVNANFQTGNLSFYNISSLPAGCVHRKHTSSCKWGSDDFNETDIQTVLIFKYSYVSLLHWDNLKVFISL